MVVALAADHGGIQLKRCLRTHLEAKGIEVRDYGTDSEASCDYPDYVVPAARAVADGTCDRGIVICTTGIGVSIAANKVSGVRCGLCFNTTMARLTREHNNANMLALGAGMVGELLSLSIADVFLSTEFSEEERHRRRIDKISEAEAPEADR